MVEPFILGAGYYNFPAKTLSLLLAAEITSSVRNLHRVWNSSGRHLYRFLLGMSKNVKQSGISSSFVNREGGKRYLSECNRQFIYDNSLPR